MIYSTSKCPTCGKVIRQQTNPMHEIGNPFERCRWCGNIYRDSYKEEWITKSPVKRVLFYLHSGVWARAFMLPPMMLVILMSIFDLSDDMLSFFWPILSLAWLIGAYFLYKNASQEEIEESLNRTKNVQYLNALIQAGYKIYPVDKADDIFVMREQQDIREYEKKSNNLENQIRFCRKCGQELRVASKYCSRCGEKVIGR